MRYGAGRACNVRRMPSRVYRTKCCSVVSWGLCMMTWMLSGPSDGRGGSARRARSSLMRARSTGGIGARGRKRCGKACRKDSGFPEMRLMNARYGASSACGRKIQHHITCEMREKSVPPSPFACAKIMPSRRPLPGRISDTTSTGREKGEVDNC